MDSAKNPFQSLCFRSGHFIHAMYGWVLILSAVILLSHTAYGQYGGGGGSAESPYLICTAEQMNIIGLHPEHWDAHFTLMADLDLGAYSGEQFNIIGSRTAPFTGSFDGKGHKLLNFTCHTADRDHIGLFGFIQCRTIRNLGLISPDIHANQGHYVGALVGFFYSGTISGCYVHGGSVSGEKNVGGLVGGTVQTVILSHFILDLKLRCCYATLAVSGRTNVGGLVGYFDGYEYPLLQDHYHGIVDCYAGGRIAGVEGVGGLTGCFQGERMVNCYSSSHVSGSSLVGGLIGRTFFSAVVLDSFWDMETSGQTHSIGGIGKSTVDMQQRATYEGWDFAEIWDMAEHQTYPFLRHPLEIPRWDLMMIEEAQIWKPLLNRYLYADHLGSWPERKAALESIVAQYPDSQWADDAALILACGRYEFEWDVEGSIRALRDIGRIYPQEKTVVTPWWTVGEGCHFDDVWLMSQGGLVFLDPDGTVRSVKPFDRHGVIAPMDQAVLVYFEHLEDYPRWTKTAAGMFLAQILSEQGDIAGAISALEAITVLDTNVSGAVARADAEASLGPYGCHLQDLIRPEHEAFFWLMGLYERQGEPEKAMSTADAFAACANQGPYRHAMKRLGAFYRDHGFAQKARTQYQSALFWINTYIEAHRDGAYLTCIPSISVPGLTQEASELEKDLAELE